MTPDRRRFLIRAGTAAAGTALGLGAFARWRWSAPSWLEPVGSERGLVRPPGARPEAEFLSRCIRCQRCAQACPTDAIRLAGAGSGRHAGTPYIVPRSAACNLCATGDGARLQCTHACPTGALTPLEDRRAVRMGTAVVDERLCVCHNESGICGACFTACPLRGRAITQGMRLRPTVHADVCVGCGLCEAVCIVKGPRPAIRVHSPRSWS